MSAISLLLLQLRLRNCMSMDSSGKTSRTNQTSTSDALTPAPVAGASPSRPVSDDPVIPHQLSRPGGLSLHIPKQGNGAHGGGNRRKQMERHKIVGSRVHWNRGRRASYHKKERRISPPLSDNPGV